MNSDSRILIYLSVMVLIFSCVVLGYGLLFFGWGPRAEVNAISIPPAAFVAAGVFFASINGLAGNVLASELQKQLENAPLKAALRFAIPAAAFLVTLALSILMAILST